MCSVPPYQSASRRKLEAAEAQRVPGTFGFVVTLRAPIRLPWKAFSNRRFGTLGVLCIPWLVVFERPTIFSDSAGNLEFTFICFGTRI